MATAELQIRTELAEVINELTDADVVFEVAKPQKAGAPQSPPVEAIEEAIEASLRAFVASVELHVERVAVLEELSKSSLTIWFRFHAPRGAGRENLAEGPDPALLKYAAQGVLTILSWMGGRSELRLSDLQRALRVLAWGTSATSYSHPALPSSVDLLNAITAWQRVRDALRGSASARLILQQGTAGLDLTSGVPVLASLLDKKVVNRSVELIAVVELPDYAGRGEWLLKHGQARFKANCGSCELLERFYRRELDIRPGDALHCRVEFDTAYGPDFEVVEERLSVIEILEVLPASGLTEPDGLKPDAATTFGPKPVDEVQPRMLVL